MPIPAPNKDEKQNDFISRCVSSLADTDPDRPNEQRIAVCFTAWRRAKGIKAAEESMPEGLRYVFFDEKNDFKQMDIQRQGVRFYRKPVLKFGTWKHPENKDIEFEITPAVVERIVLNFTGGVPVEAPVVLTHTNNPKAKVGQIKQFISTDKGLDAVFSVEDGQVITNIESFEKSPGVSCWLDLNYKDKQSGKDLGAVVKHIALVNHPYIEGLGKFEAVSLSEDIEAEKFVPLIMREENLLFKDLKMPENKDDLIKELKLKHEIDVMQLTEDLRVLNSQIESGELIKKEDASALLKEAVLQKVKEAVKLDENVTDVNVIIEALLTKIGTSVKLSDEVDKERVKLSEKVTMLENMLTEMKGEAEVSKLVEAGKVLPVEKEVFLTAYKEQKSLYDKLVASRAVPLVELIEKGGMSDESVLSDAEKDLKEIDKQVKLAESDGLVSVKK